MNYLDSKIEKIKNFLRVDSLDDIEKKLKEKEGEKAWENIVQK